MKDIQQLIKKNSQEGRYEDIFPKTFIDAVEDRESGNNLTEILSGFNMYFLSYNGSRELTRLQVPLSLRKTGLWITYVLYDKTVVTEWYAGEAIDDASWKSSDNWRVGSNMLVGDISISSDGYWVVNGVITTTKAQGEQGITPMLRVGSNNHLQVSYTNGSSWVDSSTNPVYTQFRVLNNKLQQSTDLGNTYTYISEELAYKFQESGNKLQMSKDLGNTWEDVSDYIAAWFRFTGTTGSSQADNVGKIQISRDNGVTWADLSGEFTNSLHIKGYVATIATLPSSAVQGDIYGVGPTYDPSDTGQTNPIYQLYVKDITGWVNNGKFTSIAAGVVQTTGTSTTEVMSQDAVSKELASLEKEIINSEESKIQAEAIPSSNVGKRLQDNGVSVTDADYNVIPYAVTEGDLIRIISPFVYEFMTVKVAQGSTSNYEQYKVGDAVAGNKDVEIKVPVGAKFVLISQLVSGSQDLVFRVVKTSIKEDIAAIKTDLSEAKNAINVNAEGISSLNIVINGGSVPSIVDLNDINSWAKGTISTTTGEELNNQTSNLKARSTYFLYENDLSIIGASDTPYIMYVNCYDENKTWIGVVNSQASGQCLKDTQPVNYAALKTYIDNKALTIDAWKDIKYLRLSSATAFATTEDNSVSAMLDAVNFTANCHGDAVESSGLKSDVENIKNIIYSDKYIKINVGSTRQVKTLKEAFDIIGDGTADKPNYVYLDAEVYNVFDGIDLSTVGTGWKGLDVPNHTYLFGSGIGTTIIEGSIPSGRTDITYNNISTLNMEFVGGCENMTIKAHNLRYCIHSDVMRSNDQELEENIVHKNVEFWHDGLDSEVSATGIAYGAGMRSGSTLHFIDCVFHNNAKNKAVFNNHNNAAALKPSTLIFEGCTMYNERYIKNGALAVMSEGTGNNDKVIIKNCNISGGIYYYLMTGVTTFDQRIYGSGNGELKVLVENDAAYENIYLDNFERLVAGDPVIEKGQPVFKSAESIVYAENNPKFVCGIALTDAQQSESVIVQIKGLIQCSSVGITGSDKQLIGIVDGKLGIVTSNEIGFICGGGKFIKL